MKTTFNRFAKTIALAAFMFLAFTMSAFAKPTDVSKYLVKQFQNQFQNAANVSWKTTSDFTSASFTVNGEKVSVFYNNLNDLVGISKIIAVQDLPKTAQQTISSKYGQYNVVSVINFTDADGNGCYYIQLENNNKQTILKADESGYISNFQN